MIKKPTYILGDHHSGHDTLVKALARRGLRNARVIHLGDGEEGYPEWWNTDTPEQLNADFAQLNIEYLSIRGNHSNPYVFDGSVNLPFFRLLPDYTRLEINNKTWLFVGGAVSVNRLDRFPGTTWWPEEEMFLDVSRAKSADILVTHTGPSWTTPPLNDFVAQYAAAEEDIGVTTLLDELRDEAARHDRLFELVQPRQWYFGHHHKSATHHHQGCVIRQLDVAELVLHHSSRST